MADIFRIVITGGPCAGKTTAMVRLSERLESLGFRVYKVPEAATLVFNGGVKREDLEDYSRSFGFQEALMKQQIALEKTFYNLACDIDQKVVILCDRGLMDSKAFMVPELWDAVLDHNDWSEVGLRDRHYDAVIHMVTAANGAEEFYTLENNVARIETPNESRQIDINLQSAWTGHPHFRIIDNSTDFDTKIKRVMSSICRVIGVPEPLEIEKKFLVKKVNELPPGAQTFDIEQSYIYLEDGSNFRLRKRGRGNNNVYTKTIKRSIRPGVRVELEEKITSRDYLRMLSDDRVSRVESLSKTRTCFLWNNQYFELDHVKSPKEITLLELELDDENDAYEIPPFIDIDKDVTSDESFSNSRIAAVQC